MSFFQESSAQKEKFRVAAHRLLNYCFLLKKKEETRTDYFFVVQHRESFREFFDLLGYRLDINETYGLISLVSLYGTGRLRLKKIESIVLLLLRLLFIEKSRELRWSEDVVIRTEELHEKYAMLKIEAKATLDKTTTRDVLRLFKRYQLVELLDRDPSSFDSRIKIYPSILFALPNDQINAGIEIMNQVVKDKLSSYMNSGDSEDDEHEEEIMPDSVD